MKVGDKLYDWSLEEYTVSKVGRKYAYLDGRNGLKVDMGTMTAQKWNGTVRLYADRQAVADEKESFDLLQKIRQYFSMWKNPVTLEKLREVSEVIFPEIPEKH